MILLTKNYNKKLCNGLSHNEFQCKCEFDACNFTIINEKLLEVYETFRGMVNQPLTITSGHRCQQHHFYNVYDQDVLKLTKSRHLSGEAIDISIKNLLLNYHHYTIVELAKNAGFTFVKYYQDDKFIHCDVR